MGPPVIIKIVPQKGGATRVILFSGGSVEKLGGHRRRIARTAIAGAVLAGVSAARGQIATLDKGHQFFLNNGVQVWGLDQGATVFNYNNLLGANFNGVVWSYGQAG